MFPVLYSTMGKFTIFAIVVIGVVWGYGIYTDVESVYIPSCPIKKITDFDCPTCGTQRQIHDLLMGDFRSAISHNPFTLLSVLYLLLIVRQMKKKSKSTVNIILNLCFLLCYILWGILRNVYDL